VLVVWLFLRDWRATFVSAVALPMSVIPAFIGMYLLGFSINVVTLLALSLVVGHPGRRRHRGGGEHRAPPAHGQDAVRGGDGGGRRDRPGGDRHHLHLIAVFLPTAFMSGIAGKFFKQFGWTAALAVFASLVVARVLTPMMAAYMLKPITASTRTGLAALLHALGALEHDAPAADHGARHAVLSSARWR
jgi:multidrug efflux pump subunit AcrB